MSLYDILKKWTDLNSGNLPLARKIATGLVQQQVLRMLLGFNEWWIVDGQWTQRGMGIFARWVFSQVHLTRDQEMGMEIEGVQWTREGGVFSSISIFH
jgi:hypothetical protein